jgi:intein/homing endonuclease
MEKDFDFVKVKKITKVGEETVYSLMNKENFVYEGIPNYLVEGGFVSKNSKHACVHENSLVLTARGYVKIKSLRENDRIAYLDAKGNVKLTKHYDKIKAGVKKVYKVTTKSGKTMLVTKDHELFTGLDSDDIRKEKLENLKVGDFVITM